MFSNEFLEQFRQLIREELQAVKQPAPPPQSEYMSVEQAALYLGVSRWTVYMNSERGSIPFVKVGLKAKRFLRSDLDSWAVAMKQNMPNSQFNKKVETAKERLREAKKPKK